MSAIEIIIPWRDPGCQYRKRNFDYVYNYYSEFGDVKVVDSTFSIFNRSNARNIGAKYAVSEVFLLVDADCIVSKEQVVNGIQNASDMNRIIHPYNRIHFLNDLASIRYMGKPSEFQAEEQEYVFKTPDQVILENSGGAYVVIKSQWDAIGGMSELFTGWGGEDSEFNIRYRKTYGPIPHIRGDLYSLYHPVDRSINQNNFSLFLDQIKSQNT